MRAYEHLLDYVVVHTTSDDDCMNTPSTQRQFDLAHILVKELQNLGIADAYVDEKCCVYGKLPATTGCEDVPKIGLLAHMDTAPDFNGEGVKPCVITNYDGKDVPLGESGRVLSVAQFPHLLSLKGRTLITTDGTTLLGADDKAGIAEIMTALETLISENRPHGTLCICFSPDEEVGRGADAIDIAKLGADFAYTMDGGEEGEITYETFNAASAHVTIHGCNVHPGSAKNVMINALLVACELNGMLPAGDVPVHTEAYEGFFHLHDMSGNVEKAELDYIIRDHDRQIFEARKGMLIHIQALLNEKYGEGTVNLEMADSYYNMAEKIMPHFHLVENAKRAAEKVSIKPLVEPIRGGTDGARLSYEGLPCPNLGTGGFAYHGPYEHITAEGMDLSVELLLALLEIYATEGNEI